MVKQIWFTHDKGFFMNPAWFYMASPVVLL